MNSGTRTQEGLATRIMAGIEQFKAKYRKTPVAISLNQRDYDELCALNTDPLFSDPRKFAGVEFFMDDRLSAPVISGHVSHECD